MVLITKDENQFPNHLKHSGAPEARYAHIKVWFPLRSGCWRQYSWG